MLPHETLLKNYTQPLLPPSVVIFNIESYEINLLTTTKTAVFTIKKVIHTNQPTQAYSPIIFW